MDGVERIAAERKRQIEEEGYTAEHDEQHEHGQLARAAACYCDLLWRSKRDTPPGWPWNEKSWKPTPDNRIRELEKAGALIAAEIDRLLRKEK